MYEIQQIFPQPMQIPGISLLDHSVSEEIEEQLDPLIKVEIRFMDDMQEEQASSQQFSVGLMEVELNFAVLPAFFLDIADSLEQMPDVRTPTHQYFHTLLFVPLVILQKIGGRGKTPVLNMSYLVDDLHLLNQFKSDIIICWPGSAKLKKLISSCSVLMR